MTAKITEGSFLNERVKKQVSIWLISGICLRGTLVGHDDEAVFLLPYQGRDRDIQMIYKVAVSTIACTL